MTDGTGGTLYPRGAFVAFEPDGYPKRSRVIPFRFMPDSLSRQVSVDAAPTPAGTEGARSGRGAAADDSTSAGGKPPTETFTLHIRLDLADRDERPPDLTDELGVAPEIAAIEDLLYPTASEAHASTTGKGPYQAVQARPTVLLVWGPKRVVAVRIKSLTINESRFNTALNPTRAEIDAAVEVLGEADAKADAAVRAALDFSTVRRKKLASGYYRNTAGEGTKILPIGENGTLGELR